MSNTNDNKIAYLAGDTYRFKEILKADGWKWDADERCWWKDATDEEAAPVSSTDHLDALLADITGASGSRAAELGYLDYLGEFLVDELSALESTRSVLALAPNLAYYLAASDRAAEQDLNVADLLPMCVEWYAARRERLIEILRAELAL